MILQKRGLFIHSKICARTHYNFLTNNLTSIGEMLREQLVELEESGLLAFEHRLQLLIKQNVLAVALVLKVVRFEVGVQRLHNVAAAHLLRPQKLGQRRRQQLTQSNS